MWLLLSLLISLQYSRYCSSMLIAILSLIHANDVDLAPVGLVAAVIITLGLSTSTLREQKVDWSGALSCRLGERTVPEAGQLLNFCGLRVFQINKKKKTVNRMLSVGTLLLGQKVHPVPSKNSPGRVQDLRYRINLVAGGGGKPQL